MAETVIMLTVRGDDEVELEALEDMVAAYLENLGFEVEP